MKRLLLYRTVEKVHFHIFRALSGKNRKIWGKRLSQQSLYLIVVASCFSGCKGKQTVVKVTPFSHEIPAASPRISYPFMGLIDEEYQLEWTLLKNLPKKRKYFKRLSFFVKNLKTKKIVLNNLAPPYSKAKLRQIPKEKLVLILWEPPSVFLHQYQEDVLDLFGTVLTWNDDMVDGKKFIKFNYPSLRPIQENLPSFKERKFLCMIATNLKFNDFEKELYSMRRKAVEFFESKPEGTFDLYGKGWEAFKNAKGRVPDKLETLKDYKFNFCFENTHVPGYITEKIFDSFAVGAIPIYLGATNIEESIPPECFIDYRQFNGFDEMLEFLEALSEEDYNSYLTHIKAFVEGPKSAPFTRKAFCETLSQTLN